MPAGTVLWLYLWLVGSGLLVQGILSFAMESIATPPPAWTLDFLRSDPLHAGIHVGWGLLTLCVLLAAGAGGSRTIARLGMSFGVFYVALALLGVLVHHPLGLRLDVGENAFHLIVGPVALVLSVWALKQRPLRSAPVTPGAMVIEGK